MRNTRWTDTSTADDPGSIKLISDINTITDLLDKFKNAIPGSDADTLRTALDDYMTVVTNRNQCILTYNAAIELLHQALEDYQYNDQQIKTLNQVGLQIDQNLPSVCFWLRKTRDTLRLDVMQLQDLASRAIRFWGLVPLANFGAPGPLQNYNDLEVNVRALDSNFQLALTQYSGDVATHWPPPGQQGIFYELTRGQLGTLKIKQPDPSANTSGLSYPRTEHKSLSADQSYISSAVSGAPLPTPYKHGVVIPLVPGIVSGDSKTALFAADANVRLSQIRLWLIGVKVDSDATNRALLYVDITQLGRETIIDSTRHTFQFSHDPVLLSFAYDTTGIESITDCTPDKAFGSESISGDYQGTGVVGTDTTAPLGPWATWRFEIRSVENGGLDMSGVTEAWIEFNGLSRPIQR
jgi:hypothetical protein